VAASVSGLFQLLDSGLALEKVADQAERSVGLSRPGFRELVHDLSERYGLIRLRSDS
jgi:hypothetical protein